jgi:hypothetical protein
MTGLLLNIDCRPFGRFRHEAAMNRRTPRLELFRKRDLRFDPFAQLFEAAAARREGASPPSERRG